MRAVRQPAKGAFCFKDVPVRTGSGFSRLEEHRLFIAAERPRAMLSGGQGIARPILAHLGTPGTSAISPASKVSISELLGATSRAHSTSRLKRLGHVDEQGELPGPIPGVAIWLSSIEDRFTLSSDGAGIGSAQMDSWPYLTQSNALYNRTRDANGLRTSQQSPQSPWRPSRGRGKPRRFRPDRT